MVSPIGSLVSLNQNSEQPNVNPNRFHTLKSAISSLAVIETTRLVAGIGVLFFGYTSKLIPAALCLTIATIACILKNRVNKLDAKNPEEGQVGKPLSRSASIISVISRISNKSNVAKSRESLSSLPPIREENPQTIKEVFLNSIIEDRVGNKPQWHDKLAICYLFLLQKYQEQEMPDSLSKSWWEKLPTKEYLSKQASQHIEAGTDIKKWKDTEVSQKSKGDICYSLEKATENEGILAYANPSEVMEIVQELYTKMSKRETDQTQKAYFSKKADHAKKYGAQLKAFETMPFAKDS
ncbi:MAG: hypothetical protein ACRDAI_06375, partial [Candidatus Rhabdochlamydia sp.]